MLIYGLDKPIMVELYLYGSPRLAQSEKRNYVVDQINVKEYRRGNQKLTIQRNWQH